jgi:hypothetical protein
MSAFTRRARYLTFAGLATLGLAVVAQLSVTPAATSAETYTVPLHQDTPIQNSGYGDKGDCPGSPAEWGWHFVLPGSDASFVTLTTTFENAGEIVTTTFGPPTDQHAYVYTPTDDTLVSATAEVTGGDVTFFNLSHVCAGGGTESASPTPSVTPSETPSATPSETPSETPSATPSETPSETPSATVSATETTVAPTTEAPSQTPSETPTAEVSATETVTATPSGTAEVLPTKFTRSPSASASVQGVKIVKPPVVAPSRLPTTGTPFPVAVLVLLGVGMVAAGVVTTVAGEPRTAAANGRHRR